MKTALIFTCLAGSLLLASPGIAATSNVTSSRRADFYAAGKHQFYAWCTNGQDRVVLHDGLSVPDAQRMLAQQTTGCRLSWQGRIAS